MTDEVKQNFMLAVRHTLEQAFDPEELVETELEANVGPVHRAFILVYNEWSQPTQPCVPEPTLKVQEGNDVYWIYMLSEIEARGGEITGDIVRRHPSEIGHNRPVEASEHWGYIERCQEHFKRLTGAKKLPYGFPNPLLEYCTVLSASHKMFFPTELYWAYREIAAYNQKASTKKAGEARGAQRKREVEHTTIPKLELEISLLIEEGKKPTQKAVAERSGFGIATVKRHWKHDRIVKARTPKSRL